MKVSTETNVSDGFTHVGELITATSTRNRFPRGGLRMRQRRQLPNRGATNKSSAAGSSDELSSERILCGWVIVLHVVGCFAAILRSRAGKLFAEQDNLIIILIIIRHIIYIILVC